MLGGDKNDLKISSLLSGIPRLRQIVTNFTYNRKVLDIILTNLSTLYSIPVIVLPDNPLTRSPSDHSTAVATHLTQDSARLPLPREYVTKSYRPLPDSGIREFGQWICGEEWEPLSGDIDPTEQVSSFECLMNRKLDAIFPLKTVRINPNIDVPFYTRELKDLDRRVKREYRKNYKSQKYQRMKKLYDEKYQKAAKAYLEKNVRSLKEDDPGKAYRSLKKMAAQPGDCSDEGGFTLQSHLDDNLTQEESVERIATHFSQISQEFPPFDFNLLPDNVKTKISCHNPEELPEISDYEVYEQIRSSKKPRSSVPGDLPRRIVQEFSPELATPAAEIFRNILKTAHWPKQWRLEYGTPLQKQPNPLNEDQIRIISLTSYLSKQFEQFIINWLMKYVSSQKDWASMVAKKEHLFHII